MFQDVMSSELATLSPSDNHRVIFQVYSIESMTFQMPACQAC